MRLATALRKVIALATTIRDYWAVELPKRHPDYPFVDPETDDGPPPPEEKKLLQLLKSLPDETIYKLALIAYLGRGNAYLDDLTKASQTVNGQFESPAEAIAWLMHRSPSTLAVSLEDGLSLLKENQFDVEKLDFTTAGA